MTRARLSLLPVGLLLFPLIHCGGGNTPAPPPVATTIAYENPANVAPQSYYLNRNAALSTATRLVLDLYGPASVSGSGVVAAFTLDTAKAAWANAPLANGSVFGSNGNGAPIVKAKIDGGALQVVVTECGTGTAKVFGGPLLSIALDMKTGSTSGTTVVLAPDLTRSQVLAGSIVPMADLRVGTITLK